MDNPRNHRHMKYKTSLIKSQNLKTNPLYNKGICLQIVNQSLTNLFNYTIYRLSNLSFVSNQYNLSIKILSMELYQ